MVCSLLEQPSRWELAHYSSIPGTLEEFTWLSWRLWKWQRLRGTIGMNWTINMSLLTLLKHGQTPTSGEHQYIVTFVSSIPQHIEIVSYMQFVGGIGWNFGWCWKCCGNCIVIRVHQDNLCFYDYQGVEWHHWRWAPNPANSSSFASGGYSEKVPDGQNQAPYCGKFDGRPLKTQSWNWIIWIYLRKCFHTLLRVQ